jgi:hypothetical protein
MAVEGMHSPYPRRGKRRQAAERTRFRHMGMNYMRLEIPDEPCKPDERKTIVHGVDFPLQRFDDTGGNAFPRRTGRHIPLSCGCLPAHKHAAKSVGRKVRGQKDGLNSRSSYIQARNNP